MKNKKSFIVALILLLLSLTACNVEIPETPKQLSFQTDAGVKLSWNSVDNVDFYRVYRISANETDYRFIDDTYSTEYTDNTVDKNKEYEYKVTAVNGSKESDGAFTGTISFNSKTNNDTVIKELYAPTISSITKMDKYTNVIIFESENDSCYYEVSRCSTVEGKYNVIGTTYDKAYYDESAEGNSYYYSVTAVNGTNRSLSSAPKFTGENAKKVIGVPVIMYHEFITQTELDNGVAFDEYAIWQSEFENDLKWLKDNGYTTITTKQLSDYLQGKGTMPEKPILLTADDGKYGVYKNAYPLLKKYNMSISLALIGYEIDAATNNPEARSESDAPYCTWDEILEMSNSGNVEMISHTQTMHIFSHNNRTGANCAENESYESFLPVAQADYLKFNSNMREHIGTGTVAMAYPYSRRSEVSDRAWIKSGYNILLGGDDSRERKTYINYYVAEAGVNSKSAVARRLVRMTGTPLKNYIESAVAHDN